MATFPDVQTWLDQGKVIILDGATGTELQRRGVPMHGFAWSAEALDTYPETVRAVHEDYIRAGADVIITNSFSTARHVLATAASWRTRDPASRWRLKPNVRGPRIPRPRPVPMSLRKSPIVP